MLCVSIHMGLPMIESKGHDRLANRQTLTLLFPATVAATITATTNTVIRLGRIGQLCAKFAVNLSLLHSNSPFCWLLSNVYAHLCASLRIFDPHEVKCLDPQIFPVYGALLTYCDFRRGIGIPANSWVDLWDSDLSAHLNPELNGIARTSTVRTGSTATGQPASGPRTPKGLATQSWDEILEVDINRSRALSDSDARFSV